MANEYTLADYEALAPDNLNKAVIRKWREASPILDMLTFKSDAQLSQRFLRFSSLPTTHWRKISETFQDVKINPDLLEERLYFFGDKIDIPYEYVKAPSMVNNRAAQEEAVMKAQAFMFNEAFFINSPLTGDEDAIVGLWYRLINDFASAQSYDASGLDISPDTAATNVSHKLFDLLGELLDRVDGDDSQKVLFMNRTVHMRLQSLMRQANLLFKVEDGIHTYNTYGNGGPKIVQAGYKVDQSTQILPDTEVAGGTALTGGATSSIFCVRFGEPYLAGWNQEAPFAEDVGLIEARTHYRTVVRGSAGLYINHPRAIARAFNIVAA
jgi:hypothetical protein